MIDYDLCEQMAMAEAMPIIAKAVENIAQATEASEMITYYISVGVRKTKDRGRGNPSRDRVC